MSVDPQAIRAMMRLWTTGVTVVTSVHEGIRAGITVNTFTSVSLEPPLTLVCLHKETFTARTIIEANIFAISILGERQEEIAKQFAGHTSLPEGADRFINVPITTQITGAPILSEAIGWCDCRVSAVHDGGTHWIIVGEILATGRREDDTAPLVYYNRDYRHLPL
jgi:flavin reductase (DIM6/NTAB) family NADH-FMN oxidoreductase RutF